MKKSLLVKTGLLLLCTLILSTGCQNTSDESEKDTKSTLDLSVWSGDENYTSPTDLPTLQNQSTGLSENWWKSSAFYHIWIKSFKDSDQDDCSKNCGDFKGIEDNLDYIQNDVGCDTIWLSPFWDCYYKESTNAASAALNMHGYDVNDFYKVNAYFGTGSDATSESAEEELISLINACHERGMKIIFDFVPNHTSHQNQWFLDSAARKNGKSDWYLWSSTTNSWKNTWGATAWHKNTTRGAYYYAAFADTQPDLNYRNYEVREEMKNVVRYWLNKGFDGLRIDAVRYLVETDSSLEDTDETHAWFQELREVVDSYESPKFMVCEAWIENDRTTLNKYFGTSSAPEFNMVLDFDQGWTCIDDVNYNRNTYVTSRLFTPSESTYTYGTFLGNHDEYHARLGDWFGEGTSSKAILATALSLLRPTVPFIYYGNEIAQKSGSQSGDFRLRQPFKWTLAASQKSDAASTLSANAALLALRQDEDYKDMFANGTVNALTCDMVITGSSTPWKGALAYTIAADNQKLLVVANLTGSEQATLWFSDFGLSTLDGYSLLVGNSDATYDISSETYDSKTDAVFHNFSPYEIRVYDLKNAGKDCVFDIWDYTATM